MLLNPATLAGLALTAMLPCTAAVAANPPGFSSPLFEVTPFIGYRVGGKFELIDTGESVKVADHQSLAVALDLRDTDTTQYEVFYGRQATVLSGSTFAPTSIKVEYLHLGGTLVLDDTKPVIPYLAGGLGVTRLSPDAAQGSDDTRFSISLALGLRVPVSRHFSLRLEGRGFLTPINTDSSVFCHSNENGSVCAIRASGSLFFQFDFLAGATYAFRICAARLTRLACLGEPHERQHCPCDPPSAPVPARP